MNAADRRRLTPVAATAAMVLTGLLIALWAGVGSGARWHDESVAATLPPAETPTRAPDVAPLGQYRDVWQHPLFSPTRSPEATGAGGGESSGNLHLTGVIMLPGLAMAILHDDTTGKDYRVVQGQPSRGGPALVALHARSAVVEVAGARRHLRLQPGGAGDAGAGVVESGSTAGDDDGQPAAAASAGEDASAMVSRRGGNRQPAAGQSAAAARARMLRARIDARRRGAPRSSGS